MTGLRVWANEGGGYSDNELQQFDVEVDYFDTVTGSIATLSLDDQNIGNTVSSNDPKDVVFSNSLFQVTEVRISDLRTAVAPSALATFREIQGIFAMVPVTPEIDISSSEGGAVTDGGTDAQGNDCLLYTSPSPRDRG